jgi:hypothetical protein
MDKFFEEFATACRGEDLNEQARYRCAGCIDIKQAVYALTLSPDGKLIAFGGE